MNRLHYFYDAQCGWCYAVAPLIWEAAQLPGVTLELHGGGLWPKPTVLPAAIGVFSRRRADEPAAESATATAH